MPDLKQLHEAIINGDANGARAITRQALEDETDPLRIVSEFMAPAMEEVGRRFECNEYFVPELLLSARAMKSAMELVRPLLVASGGNSAGRVVVGTVKGDMHDIGKNLVAALLEGAGFEVIDLGVNVAPESFVATAKERQAQIVAMSALLTTTMLAMKSTIEAFRQAGWRDKVKVLVGGAPVTQKYADEIGADGYGPSAVEAVAQARKLLGISA